MKRAIKVLKNSMTALLVCSMVGAATGHLLGGNAQAQLVSRHRIAENEGIADGAGERRKVAPDLEESIQIAERQSAPDDLLNLGERAAY